MKKFLNVIMVFTATFFTSMALLAEDKIVPPQVASQVDLLYSQWKKAGADFDLIHWLENTADPDSAVRINVLCGVLMRDDTPIVKTHRVMLLVLKLSRKTDPEKCVEAVSKMLCSQKLKAFSDERLSFEVLTTSAQLANADVGVYLDGLLIPGNPDFNIIRLLGWCKSPGSQVAIAEIYRERRAIWKSGTDWRSDPLLMWSTLALMRYGNAEAEKFWADRIEELGVLMKTYDGNEASWSYMESTLGLDMAYVRTPEVIRIGATATKKCGIKRPAGVFSPLEKVMPEYTPEHMLFNSSPSDTEFNVFISWLTDPKRIIIK